MRRILAPGCSSFWTLSTLASTVSMLNVQVSLGADTDRGPVNLDFENGQLGQVPTGWFLPRPSLDAGYAARLIEDHPTGRRCGLLTGENLKGSGSAFGNLMQTFDATPYRDGGEVPGSGSAQVAVPAIKASSGCGHRKGSNVRSLNINLDRRCELARLSNHRRRGGGRREYLAGADAHGQRPGLA